jgi:hypothetical protein
VPQINKPSEYFNTVLYTGTGTTQSITGVGFQPDLYWNKSRSNVNTHVWIDSIRGVSTFLASNNTDADSTPGDGMLSSFDSDGFTLNADTSGYNNFSGRTYANWCWKAGGTAVSNTDGSITSTVSANTTSGFSIVSYTGNATAGETVGHGLGVTPSMIILRNRDIVENWFVYHKDLTLSGAPAENVYLTLDTTNAVADYPVWNDTAPSSNVFTISQHGFINGSGNNIIAYCFAEKKGFSKFGSYTGNGNADGTFIYTGFKPAFVMVKRTDGANGWCMFDNKRDPENTVDKTLFAHLSNAESTGIFNSDFLSNGFKIRDTDADWNASGGNYIYMAFAEEPLVGDNPATAR